MGSKLVVVNLVGTVVFLGLTLLSLSLCQEPPIPLGLGDLRVSHGTLSPKFDPNTLNYLVTLNHAYPSLAVAPMLQDFPELSSVEGLWPTVSIIWDDNIGNEPPSRSPMPPHSSRVLPVDGRTITASILLADPASTSRKSELRYTIKVVQKLKGFEPVVGMMDLRVADDKDRDIEVKQDEAAVEQQLSTAYIGFIDPVAASFNVRVQCREGNRATVNGNDANGKAVTIYRETHHHRQVVDITCKVASGGVLGMASARSYTLSIMANFGVTEIKIPELVVDKAGRKCDFEKQYNRFICPNPNSSDLKTRLIATFDPSIRYTIESSNMLTALGEKAVQVRLINGQPTIPFDYNHYDLYIEGWAGQFRESWPIQFSAAPVLRSSHVAFIGWFLALALSVLLVTLLTTLALSNAFGIGAPFGATEIAASSAFLMQFFCFAASFLRAGSALKGIKDVIKWCTVYWAIPIASNPMEDGSSPFTHIGDTSSLTNALGCLFWCWAFVIGIGLARFFIFLKFAFLDRERNSGISHTFPHRLKFGHWESRVINFFCFPASTASMMILTSPGVLSGDNDTAGAAGVASACCTLLAVWAWIAINYFLVRTAVKQEKVIWIWNSALQEEGQEGYWVDVQCDQLNTHAVNRGAIAKKLLAWKWASTVADITPVLICGDGARTVRNWRERGEGGADTSLLGPDHLRVAANASSVDVIATRAPGVFCPGQRMVAGLLQTDWLDILLTYEGLTYFHTQVISDNRAPYVLPITAKISQLQGPIAAGRFCFFFEGVRVPFIKIEESILKIVVGMCIGTCLGLQLRALDADGKLSQAMYITLAVCFCLIGVGSAVSLIYAAATVPFTRPIENFNFCLVLTVLACSSFAFMGYAVNESAPSFFAELFMWATAGACILLAIYSTLVIFSLIGAVFCPPLEETRFLERLANCVATVAEHADGWAVDLPAFSKKETRSIKAVCQTIVPTKKPKSHDWMPSRLLVSLMPTTENSHLEFSVADIQKAALKGVLRQPLACLFEPSSSYLGYKSVNVYPKDDILEVVDEFITGEPLTAAYSPQLTKNIVSCLERQRAAERRPILSVAVIPPTSKAVLFETPEPKNTMGSPAYTLSSSGSSVATSRTSTSRSSRGFEWSSTSSRSR